MRRATLFAFVILAVLVIQSHAQSGIEKTDDTDCRIEDWRWAYNDIMKMITIEGTTSCPAGRIIIRSYTGADGSTEYLGNADGYVDGHAFTALVTSVESKPDTLSIKYSMAGN